jgi:hypothetical protein
LHEIGFMVQFAIASAERLLGGGDNKVFQLPAANTNQPDFCLFDIERIEPPNRKWKRTDLTTFVKIIQQLLSSRGAS